MFPPSPAPSPLHPRGEKARTTTTTREKHQCQRPRVLSCDRPQPGYAGGSGTSLPSPPPLVAFVVFVASVWGVPPAPGIALSGRCTSRDVHLFARREERKGAARGTLRAPLPHPPPVFPRRRRVRTYVERDSLWVNSVSFLLRFARGILLLNPGRISTYGLFPA